MRNTGASRPRPPPAVAAAAVAQRPAGPPGGFRVRHPAATRLCRRHGSPRCSSTARPKGDAAGRGGGATASRRGHGAALCGAVPRGEAGGRGFEQCRRSMPGPQPSCSRRSFTARAAGTGTGRTHEQREGSSGRAVSFGALERHLRFGAQALSPGVRLVLPRWALGSRNTSFCRGNSSVSHVPSVLFRLVL